MRESVNRTGRRQTSLRGARAQCDSPTPCVCAFIAASRRPTTDRRLLDDDFTSDRELAGRAWHGAESMAEHCMGMA